jgi:hypothetical protein
MLNWISKKKTKIVILNKSRPKTETSIKETPATSPTCPSPTVGETTKIVTGFPTPEPILEINTTDTPNTLIITISIQKILAEKKEIRMRHAIIFKDYPLGFILKKP